VSADKSFKALIIFAESADLLMMPRLKNRDWMLNYM
jgi:hypothetical protein